ncbi:MAG: TolC family protein [Oscillospiraceae bacterium]|nr:TolC family protein [Oscillospiraceae bacterium]
MKKLFFRTLSSFLAFILLLTPVSATAETVSDTSASTLSWEKLEEQIKAKSPSYQILDKNISSIEIVDYTYLYNSMQKQLNELSSMQSFLLESGDREKLNSVNSSMAALRNTYEDIRDGKLQRDSDDAVNKLRDMQNQVLSAGQTLYITILSLEQSLADGERGLSALQRALTEMQLRHTLGQVSDIKLKELERKYDDTKSQLKTLENTITSLKAQLQLLIGEAPTGEAELEALPPVSVDEISSLTPETDLIAAKEKNYSISTAAVALEKAEEDVSDKNSDYLSGSIKRYELTSAEHTRDAAKLSLISAEQSFEFSFRNLHRSVLNYLQIWENKKATAEYQQQLLALSEKQYELGRISYFALLNAQDNASNALSDAESAERDLFSALNNYRNAVMYGFVNEQTQEG